VRQPDPTAPAELQPASPEPGADAAEAELDPELLAIAAPPQAQRLGALTVMAAAVVAMAALVFSLRSDMAYTFAERMPVVLGSADRIDTTQLVPNTYVSLAGVPSIARAVRFRRGLGSAYVLFPLAGKSGIYVQTPDDGGEGFVRSAYVGRLATFGSLGRRYAQLAQVMRDEAGLGVEDDTLVLLVGEQPSDYGWTWLVAVCCVLFTALDVFLIVRWFKPLRWIEAGRE
jgi:hypothetical protein